MASRAYAYTGHVFFRGPRQGWSETLQLATSSYADAIDSMGKILTLRTWLLASDCSIASAVVRKLGKPRDSQNVKATYPIAGGAGAITSPPSVAVSLPENVAVLCRFDALTGTSGATEVGLFANYWLHGLPKTVVTGSKLVDNAGDALEIVTTPFVGTPAGGTPATWGAALNNYLQLLGDFTLYRRDERTFPLYKNPGQAINVTEFAWSDIEVTGVRTHKTGRFADTSRGRR